MKKNLNYYNLLKQLYSIAVFLSFVFLGSSFSTRNLEQENFAVWVFIITLFVGAIILAIAKKFLAKETKLSQSQLLQQEINRFKMQPIYFIEYILALISAYYTYKFHSMPLKITMAAITITLIILIMKPYYKKIMKIKPISNKKTN